MSAPDPVPGPPDGRPSAEEAGEEPGGDPGERPAPFDRTGCYAVLIGNSVFKDKDLIDVPAARRSLDAFEAMMVDPALCGWRRSQVLKLAEWEGRIELVQHVQDLIAAAQPHTLLFLYVGHGSLVNGGRDLALALKDSSSRRDKRWIDSLLLSDIRALTRPNAAGTLIEIFDCCYSGIAAERGLGDDELSAKVRDVVDTRGILTLTASRKNTEAVYEPGDDGLTVYCRYFTDVVRHGIPGPKPVLTILDVHEEVWRRFAVTGAEEQVGPVWPEPHQVLEGRAHLFPFAVNRAYDPNAPARTPAAVALGAPKIRRRAFLIGATLAGMAAASAGTAFALDGLRRDSTPPTGHPDTGSDTLPTEPVLPTTASSPNPASPAPTASTAAAPSVAPTRAVPTDSSLEVSGYVWGLAYSRKGPPLLAVGTSEGELRLWHTTGSAGLAPAGAAVMLAGDDSVTSLMFSPTSPILAVGTQSGAVRLYQTSAGGLTYLSSMQSQSFGVPGVAFSNDGTMLASAGLDNSIVLWDLSDPAYPAQAAVLSGHTKGVNTVVFSPVSNTVIASGSYDDTVRLWQVSDPSVPVELCTPLSSSGGVVFSVVFSPDAVTLACGTGGGTVELWDTTDLSAPKPLGTPADAQTDRINGMACNQYYVLASTSVDGTVQLTDIRDPTHPAAVGPELNVPSGSAEAVAFTPDGLGLAVGDVTGTVRFWRLI